ncbi:polygalacturonase QRT2 [Citrus sinensis]|uniref:Polygalacturonase QRT2 n=1 Tax=Citrus sinensis TaxID=2711 RepID=A0ACB8LME7_CITSI|nr:polygalacturonase QRT2 [Citrus sinensis]
MHPQRQYWLPIFLAMLVSFFSFSFSSYQGDRFVTTRDQYRRFGSPIWVDSESETTLMRLYGRASAPASSTKIVNVDDFEAKADGTDDSKAFMEAWEEACSSENEAVLVVPNNKIYHLKPITFSGPCKSDLTMKTTAEIQGIGLCSKMSTISESKVVAQSTAMEKFGGENLAKSTNPSRAMTHQRALNLLVIAPGNSPNTDGIHVTGTQNILIKNCVIRTGDDCISIVSGSKNVRATDIICGPGHGISIGSLGAGNSEAFVSNVLVNRARLSGTTNGVRIKTWQGGSGFAKDILFQNVEMRNVTNPIIIDQHYCDQEKPCQEQASAVQVSNVVYQNIKGTSASEVAIKLDCSNQFPCRGLVLQDVILRLEEEDDVAKASCSNVRLSPPGNFLPRCI